MKRLSIFSVFLLSMPLYAANWSVVYENINDPSATLFNLKTLVKTDVHQFRIWQSNVIADPQSPYDLVLKYQEVTCAPRSHTTLQEKYYSKGKLLAPRKRTNDDHGYIDWGETSDLYKLCEEKPIVFKKTFTADSPKELSEKVIKYLRPKKESTHDPFL